VFDQGETMATEAEKEEAKRQYRLQNPNGPRMSVNVGGYGNLSFKDNSEFEQFQKNPQSMTYAQGPGGQRYVEPKSADYESSEDMMKSFNKPNSRAQYESERQAGDPNALRLSFSEWQKL
jgi:hypothetical protein